MQHATMQRLQCFAPKTEVGNAWTGAFAVQQRTGAQCSSLVSPPWLLCSFCCHHPAINRCQQQLKPKIIIHHFHGRNISVSTMKSSKKPGSAGKSGSKQGTLFSFFSKKPKNTSASPPKVTDKGNKDTTNKQVAHDQTASNASATAEDPTKNQLWKKLSLRDRIGVYWPDDNAYYNATVTKQRTESGVPSGNFFIKYDDGESEWIDLSQHQFRFLKRCHSDDSNTKRSSISKTGSSDAPTNAKLPASKRRRIESDEEEFEFEDSASEGGDDDDGSAYDPKSAGQDEDDGDEDEDGNWMVSDDEDDAEIVKPKKKLKVTKHEVSKSSLATEGTTPVASSRILSSSSNTANFLAAFKSPSSSAPTTVTPRSNASMPKVASSAKRTPVAITNDIQSNPASQTKLAAKDGKSPMAVKNELNVKGSHVHNHLKFLQDPRDANGIRKGDPGYDPRTLKVDQAEFERHAKFTNATKQWWDLKSQYFDTVLLFKTGKFYEMFHMDADIGVEVLGFTYMKGHVAHAGFPEIGYASYADRLVRAGYKVARVEQTETPDMLAQRKKNKKRGEKAPGVVNREICSIMTLGTRTFCYLDDQAAILEEQTGGSGGTGPLLAIRETLVEHSDDGDDGQDELRPVCEYGITIVDAVRGTVTLGQFADDVLRSRMHTLLTTYAPSEIIIEGGENGASRELQSAINSMQTRTAFRVEKVQGVETFPRSTALSPEIRKNLERPKSAVHPWDFKETLDELHRRGYYPRSSKNDRVSISRWPSVLRAVVEGGADLAVSSFGAALFYLQRNLIDADILGMGIVKAYVPPAVSAAVADSNDDQIASMMTQQYRQESEMEIDGESIGRNGAEDETTQQPIDFQSTGIDNAEDQTTFMALDGTTLHNLEILTNSVDHKVSGSLWEKINCTKTPHGSRMLLAWLLRPLFRKDDIDRRTDAVQELVSGAGAVGLTEAQRVLGKIGDLDRLLGRVHSMSGEPLPGAGDDSYHPKNRQVMYEEDTYTKRKVADFSKILHGLKEACQIPSCFADMDLESGLLKKIVRLKEDGGCFPDMEEAIDWYFSNFDLAKAAKGLFEPSREVDEEYDEVCSAIDRIQGCLEEYKNKMCRELRPQGTAMNSWKYINVKPNSKDKYLIELPASVRVPEEFVVKGKRGSGHKQVLKYRTPHVAELVRQLEAALDVQSERKEKGMQIIFSRFYSQKSLWAAAATATALLDALGSLAKIAGKPGYTRARIRDANGETGMKIVQGRHPCVESSANMDDEFVPNDLALGSGSETDSARVLLLSGPNMGGKSTLLRQTCLIAILAQIGSFVPADECELTPIDCIYTRLGASDRILLGQSTFFVELAETAAALRGATRRSLVIMDELGRGTSTFDGTAIASATVKHLVERSRCFSLFATHYHSLLEDWRNEPAVRLGHMQCIVDNEDDGDDADMKITFLYTLGTGTMPRSFGVNVARLAHLPQEVLVNAREHSALFEEEVNGTGKPAGGFRERLLEAVRANQWELVREMTQK